MAIVSISEAAKLSGKDRTTIYRYIRHGKLSKAVNGIDTSELMRVFGDIKTPQSATVVPHVPNHTAPQNESVAVLQKEIELLRQQLAREQTIVSDLQKRLDSSEQERRATQERLTALLGHQPIEKAPIEQTQSPINDGVLSRFVKKFL